MTQHQGFPAESGTAGGAGEVGTAAPPPEQLFAQALALHHAGQLAQADHLYRAVLAADPNHVGSLHHLGIIALATGRHQDAKTFLAKAIALNERSPQCHYHMGLAFALLGSMDDAAAHNKRAIELDPDYADAHLNLGNVFKTQGDLSEAAACYQRVLALRAKTPEAITTSPTCSATRDNSMQQSRTIVRRWHSSRTILTPTTTSAPPSPPRRLGRGRRTLPTCLGAQARAHRELRNLASVLLAAGDAGAAVGVVARGFRSARRRASRRYSCSASAPFNRFRKVKNSAIW
jgi:tetratricopeptide (TPR) repeat protein